VKIPGLIEGEKSGTPSNEPHMMIDLKHADRGKLILPGTYIHTLYCCYLAWTYRPPYNDHVYHLGKIYNKGVSPTIMYFFLHLIDKAHFEGRWKLRLHMIASCVNGMIVRSL